MASAIMPGTMSEPTRSTAAAAAQGEPTSPASVAQAATKRPWVRPTLVRYGDLRDVIMGGSPGSLESNNPGVRFPRRG